MISVIIPTCHRNDLLAKCLDCLAPGVQTLQAEQYEVIVTDDGSCSTAEKLVREAYPWALWVAGPRRGPAANRNSGAEAAQGDWLAFTDDDCLPSSGWLEAFRSAIKSDIFVYEGKTTCQAGLLSPLDHAPINLTGGRLWSCNMMVRKPLYKTLGGFDEGFPNPHMEDTDFRERVKNNQIPFAFTATALIDHPPRRLPWGKDLGRFQESEVYYWYKSGHQQPLTYKRQLLSIVRFRMARIISSRKGKDTLIAFTSMLAELWYIKRNLKSWNSKYRALICDYGGN